MAAETQPYVGLNPDIKLFNGEVRGYGRVEFGRKSTKVTFRGVDTALREDTGAYDLSAYVVENGRHEVVKA